MNVIETNKLSKTYGKRRGVENISLEVKEGEIYGFVGPNGAGKSTTIRLLLNFIYPVSGSGKIFNKDIVKESKEIKKLIGYVPSEVRFYDDMKVKEIIEYACSFYEKVNMDEIYTLCDVFEMDLHKKMRELSLGNKKKVAIVQALVNNPKLIILDEPTGGLDPLMQKKLFDTLKALRKRGTTIFLSSHNLMEVENLCQRVAVIKEGKIIDIIEIEKERENSGHKIIIKGEKIDELLIKNIGGKEVNNLQGNISFMYYDDINKLIKELSNYKINKLLISEKTLEDKFMKYYLWRREVWIYLNMNLRNCLSQWLYGQ